MAHPQKTNTKINLTKPTLCILCGSVESKVLIKGDSFGYGEADLVCCPKCHLRWIYPLPSPAQILQFYPQKYYGIGNEKFHKPLETHIRLFRRLRAKKIIGLESNSKRVLDIGCGRGQSLKILQQYGYTCYGTELSPFSAQKASSIKGLHIYSRPLVECGFQDHFFDLVIMWHVLEHLPNPRETLQEILRILRPGGNLLLCVPNSKSLQAIIAKHHWFHLDLPRHLYHYSPSTLTTILASTGFTIIRKHTFSIEQGPFGLLQSFLNILGFPKNTLYQMLHCTWKKEKISFALRFLQMEIFFLSMPVLIIFCYFCSLFGRGGVIEIHAQKPKSMKGKTL